MLVEILNKGATCNKSINIAYCNWCFMEREAFLHISAIKHAHSMHNILNLSAANHFCQKRKEKNIKEGISSEFFHFTNVLHVLRKTGDVIEQNWYGWQCLCSVLSLSVMVACDTGVFLVECTPVRKAITFY